MFLPNNELKRCMTIGESLPRSRWKFSLV